MLLVVAYHCMVFWTGTWFTKNPIFESKVFLILSLWMNSFHVYGFVLVSGYLFYFLKCEREKYLNFVQLACNKVKRLIVPFIFVSIFWAIPFARYYLHTEAIEIFKNYVLGISPSQLWFLLMLFFVFVLFYPLTNFFEEHNVEGTLTVLVIYGMGFVGAIVFPNIYQIFTACTYLPLFWLGFKIRQYGSQRMMKIPSVVWIVSDVLLFNLIQYISGLDGIGIKILNLGLTFILHIIGAMTAFVVLQKLANKVKWKESTWFTYLSENSMIVYLFHQQIVYVFITLLNGIVTPYLHAAINFVGAMLISLMISTLLMKFKWTRFLIGEK